MRKSSGNGKARMPALAAFGLATISIASVTVEIACADGKHTTRYEQELKKSSDAIEAQRIERTKMSLNQAEQRALEISAEAERQCNAIKEEETSMIGNGRGPVFPFRAFRTATSAEIEEAKQPYEDRIKEVHADTTRRIRELLNEGQQAVDAIEQSAAHVHNGVHEFAPDSVRKHK